MNTVLPFFNGVISTFLENPLTQTMGFVAMFIWLMAYVTNDDSTTVKIFILANIFWLLHFILMSNTAATWATVIGISRLILSLKYKRNKKVLIGVIITSLVFWIVSYDGRFLSILPLIATVIGTYGFFFLEKIQLRILLLFLSCMRFTYHLGTGSMGGLVNEVVVSIAICFSIYKFYFGEEKKKYLRERIRNVLRKKPPKPDFGRYAFFRDKWRFE